DVTLDPSTAHPRLCLSPDRRSAKLGGERLPEPSDAPKRLEWDWCPLGGPGFTVLGAPGFTGGRHYWEVEVGGRRGWALGAAREAAKRKEEAAEAAAGGGSQARRELWCVGSFGKRFQALTATEQTPLSPAERPRRLRIYLDYERGQLCFYNAESMAHVHTFRACFRGRILP
ncbi:TRI41 ligase, partial [Psilopogon haemacephalus]|nr:TRI41 ligase [Psilopogon haemacephalus]